MAKYNEILVGRFARYLQKITGIKGSVPTPQLAGEISSNIPFCSFPSDYVHQGWDYFGVQLPQAGQAANNSAVRLRNPAGSNVLAVILKGFSALLQGEVSGNFLLDYNNPDGGNLTTVVPFSVQNLDARARPTPSLIFSRQNAYVTTGVNIWQAGCLGNQGYDVIVDPSHALTLLPGTSYTFSNSNLNQAVRWNVWWIERYLEESERT